MYAIRSYYVIILAVAVGVFPGTITHADETCMSPYMAKITGHEDFIYVWTLGVEGVGDGSDKLVTVDVRDGSKSFGKVIHTVSVGGRNEAHHAGFTDDRRRITSYNVCYTKLLRLRTYSGLPLTPSQLPSAPRTFPNFVANTAFSRRSRIAFPTSSSLRPTP